MNIEEIIDVEQLRSNTDGDAALVSDLVAIFEQEFPKLEAELLPEKAQSRLTISRAAHKLRGSLLALGARCTSLAEQIELHAKQWDEHHMADRCHELISQARLVTPAIHALLQRGEP